MAALPLPSLTVRLATPQELIASRKGTHAQWGKRQPLGKYLHRESAMTTLEFATEGRMHTWVLAPREGSHPFVASCETYRRESYALRQGEESAKPVISYGIASVFTPPAYRRNGYAAHMMRLLHRILAPADSLPPFPTHIWGLPPVLPEGVKCGDALFSVLYSDVGPQFYKLCGPIPGSEGWEVRDPWSTIWEVSDEDDEPPVLPTLKWLRQEDIASHLRADAWDVSARLLPRLSAQSNRTTVHVAVKPSTAQITFMNSQYVLGLPSAPALIHWGAALSAHDLKLSSYAAWTPEPHPHATLLITRLRCDSARALTTLIEAAKHMARSMGLKRVEIWNTIPSYGWMAEVSRACGGVRVRRSEHLPSIAWYGEEKKERVVWELNEKFVWC